MSYLFVFLWLFSLIGLIVGLIKPSIFSRFGLETRRNVIKIFLSSSLLFFVLTGVFAPADLKTSQKTEPVISTNQSATEIQQEDDKQPDKTSDNEQEIQESSIAAQNTTPSVYTAVKVVDGDTLDVKINDKTERIRLIGIDSPELSACFGSQASSKARELLNSKNVLLELDESQGDKDKYGRLLRYVFFENEDNFNKLMIAEGYAREYTYNLPYKYQQEFKQAQKEAIEAKRGLWANNVCQNTQNTIQQNTSATSSSNTVLDENEPPVKKSRTNICHAKGTKYYSKTIYFTPFNSIQECLDSGGRLPKS